MTNYKRMVLHYFYLFNPFMPSTSPPQKNETPTWTVNQKIIQA